MIIMYAGEIKAKLKSGGFCIIDGPYEGISLGLILKKEDDEYVIADIRQSEGKVVIPRYDNARPEERTRLKKMLSKEKIPFRMGKGF